MQREIIPPLPQAKAGNMMIA